MFSDNMGVSENTSTSSNDSNCLSNFYPKIYILAFLKIIPINHLSSIGTSSAKFLGGLGSQSL